ncbi:MAG TPA: CRISPR-associated helicase Cas3' [Anaerolineae bacterium]|nr:CRISPR-associated helicase Cas3' [Anaerolineae bacterium]
MGSLNSGQAIPTYQLLWAKSAKDSTRTHPLICHLIDVAQVALALWEDVLTGSSRLQVAQTLALDEGGAGPVLAFWAGLHDLGKASPAFQRLHAPAMGELADAGLEFAPVYLAEPCYHGTISSRLLPDLLASQTRLAPGWTAQVARAIGGHHGAWPVPIEVLGVKAYHLGGAAWDAVRRELVRALHTVLGPPAVVAEPAPREPCNALYVLLSGLTSVADWIGSMSDCFAFAERPVDLESYREAAALRARRALSLLGWPRWEPPREPAAFSQLFARPSPRPMQAQVIDLAGRLDQPALVIIEAPTGTGKTEAALYLADHWARTQQQHGLYVAMPTMATSNQMHGRVSEVVSRRNEGQTLSTLLVHGQAQWARRGAPLQVRLAEPGPQQAADEAAAMAWFLPRKRSLLAPFGVGTVDQAFLGVLQTRHFFVRLLGLSHKTVIFDEVHAYDTYMSTLFRRLLTWLRALGSSVVVLSATLPAATRRELLDAYAGTGAADCLPATYPAISWASGGRVGQIPLQAHGGRELALEWVERSPEAIGGRLRAALREGGCAAVVCNTVGRAQETYRALRVAQVVPDDNLLLFHARFPLARRDVIEREVLKRYSEKGTRPARSIVVATQVIEQSLDLDFDVMVSDLAPVDLLIQRAGRMHRHDRGSRPCAVSSPRLLITLPDLVDGVPGLGVDGRIYEPYVLLRSYLALRGRESISIPGDTAALIESVYGEAGAPSGPSARELAAARDRMLAHQDRDVDTARRKLVGLPGADNLLVASNDNLAEDDPGIHAAFRALTRLGPPSVSVSCLHEVGNCLNTEPDGSGCRVDPLAVPGPDLTQVLVGTLVAVSHAVVFRALVAQSPPPGWREHALLRDCRLVVFRDGACPLPGTPYCLYLSRSLGLEIVRA